MPYLVGITRNGIGLPYQIGEVYTLIENDRRIRAKCVNRSYFAETEDRAGCACAFIEIQEIENGKLLPPDVYPLFGG